MRCKVQLRERLVRCCEAHIKFELRARADGGHSGISLRTDPLGSGCSRKLCCEGRRSDLVIR